MTCPRLIDVALPIREISAESVRDKSLRHGHISTLHLRWARRPLAACRAVVFASLVPDPDRPECPAEFRAAVIRLLKDHVPTLLKYYGQGRSARSDPDPYRPYEGIPDTPRHRLLAFIAKWSPAWLAFDRGENGKPPAPAEMLDDRCLVKWETSDPENPQGREVLRIARELVRVANGGAVPVVLDPFAGGGAIPLEAARLGCQAIANDYNPVAYLILRATCEFPQRFGKPMAVEQNTAQPGTQPLLVASKGQGVVPEINAPNAPPDAGAHRSISVDVYGFKTFGALFNPRQLLAMQTFIACLQEALEELKQHEPDPEYRKAVAAYLGLWVSRVAQRCSNMGVWHTSRETLEHPFGRQSIAMVWDYPEANPLSEATGGAVGGIDWILRVIAHESPGPDASWHPARVHCGDGARLPLEGPAAADIVVTDPPYFDSVAYADLSDFFYVWLKRGLGDLFPEALATP